MGMHVKNIPSFENFEGLHWRQLARRIWRAEGSESLETLVRQAGSDLGLNLSAAQAEAIASEAQKRGLAGDQSQPMLLSQWASATSWDRMSHEQAAELIQACADRCAKAGGVAPGGLIQIEGLWVFGSAATRVKSDVGDVDIMARARWLGEPDASSERKDQALRKAMEWLQVDERLEVGLAQGLPERARNIIQGEPPSGDGRAFAILEIWRGASEPEEGVDQERWSAKDWSAVRQAERQSAERFGSPSWRRAKDQNEWTKQPSAMKDMAERLKLRREGSLKNRLGNPMRPK